MSGLKAGRIFAPTPKALQLLCWFPGTLHCKGKIADRGSLYCATQCSCRLLQPLPRNRSTLCNAVRKITNNCVASCQGPSYLVQFFSNTYHTVVLQVAEKIAHWKFVRIWQISIRPWLYICSLWKEKETPKWTRFTRPISVPRRS